MKWELPTGFEIVNEDDHEGLPVFINGNPFDTIAVVVARKDCYNNARLIAAAPDLLLSLTALLGAMQKRAPYKDAAIIITMAERAIAKAKGEL